VTDRQLAYAKLTTYLHVIGVRPDGYHLIDAEMVSLDLCDELYFSPGDGMEIVGSNFVPADRSNLILRALDLAGCPAHVRLIKRIPVGGGLGGGSSDAAAALRWAERPEIDLAAQIGADVPFCLRGGRCGVGGIGEILEPRSFVARTFTLLVPPFGVNTAAVYRQYDELASVNRSQHGSDINHLEFAALVVEPRLVEWRERFQEWTGLIPVLAGSGATWFVEGQHKEPPQDELRGARWIVAKTVPAVGAEGLN
jgi:4-diphosphocytidyl-2-C-methyl-D-erythritol kinase